MLVHTHTHTDTTPSFQAFGSLNVSTGQGICVDPASLLSFLLASYEAPPSCVSSTPTPPPSLFSLFQSNWNPHTTTKSPMSNLLNKLHAPSAAVETFAPDRRTFCCKVRLQAERRSSLFRPGNIVPALHVLFLKFVRRKSKVLLTRSCPGCRATRVTAAGQEDNTDASCRRQALCFAGDHNRHWSQQRLEIWQWNWLWDHGRQVFFHCANYMFTE